MCRFDKLLRTPLAASRMVGRMAGARYDGTDVEQAFATFADPPAFELYDLQKDPIEFHNLAGDPHYAPVLERLQAALLQWRWTMDDPFLDEAFVRRYIAYAQSP